MAILKSPAKPPKNETLQIRIEEGIKSKLTKYAEFIGSSESYVVSESLKLLFRRDDDFRAWLEQHLGNGILAEGVMAGAWVVETNGGLPHA